MAQDIEKRKWKLSDLRRGIVNSFVAIIQGKFLLRLNAGKYFVHILYTFFLFAVSIWVSLLIDSTLNKVEKNKKIIADQQMVISMKTYELAAINRRSKVEDLLTSMGSSLHEAEKPAVRLVKKATASRNTAKETEKDTTLTSNDGR